MIYFKDIFFRAVNLFDDPDISRAFCENPVRFQKIMTPFLLNGVSTITTPVVVTDLLSQWDAPIGRMEVFEGNGGQEYPVTMEIAEGADIALYFGDTCNCALDCAGYYDKERKMAVFSKPIQVGEQCSIESFISGAFTGDFSKVSGAMSGKTLEQRTIDILARVTVVSWAQKEKNFLLDIRNLLTDTDFKLHSPAALLKAKIDWVKQMELESFNLQNKLSWDLRVKNRSRYGYF